MRRLYPFILLSVMLLSCSANIKSGGDYYIIRYVDLHRVYSYAVNKDSRTPVTDESRIDAETKRKIYSRIKTAISNVAARQNADFVLNTGDAVLYSRNSYDMTDDVIKEYRKLNEISSPDIK